MDLPVEYPLAPMLAKAVPSLPAPDSAPGGIAYEPKWDGFRCLIYRDGDEVELASRGARPLTRYFPELVDAVRAHLPARCVLDAEVVVRGGEPGSERLNWEALAQRIHPAESRVRRLAAETPAELVCFDLLALDDEAWLGRRFAKRRVALESALADLATDAPIHLTQITRDADLAQDWFATFEGAGLDGVIAKPLSGVYEPGKRAMFKLKHSRTAEAVVFGYRVHKSGKGVGSLLLGMYHEGQLVPVGGAAAFSDATRLALIDELAPLVVHDEDGAASTGHTAKSRFSAGKDASFVRVQPELVMEVAFDQLEGHRFRHAVKFLRWRPDRDPESCLLDQVERAPAYDLRQVLVRGRAAGQ